jgi:hypothetical protein
MRNTRLRVLHTQALDTGCIHSSVRLVLIEQGKEEMPTRMRITRLRFLHTQALDTGCINAKRESNLCVSALSSDIKTCIGGFVGGDGTPPPPNIPLSNQCFWRWYYLIWMNVNRENSLVCMCVCAEGSNMSVSFHGAMAILSECMRVWGLI